MDQTVTGPHTAVAWPGSNPATRQSGKGVILFKLTWENPRPGVEVASAEFESTLKNSGPFPVALTADP